MTNAEYISNRPEITIEEAMKEARAWYAETHGPEAARAADGVRALMAWLPAERPAAEGDRRTVTVVTTLQITHVLHGVGLDEVETSGTADRLAERAKRNAETAVAVGGPRPDDVSIERVQVFSFDGDETRVSDPGRLHGAEQAEGAQA